MGKLELKHILGYLPYGVSIEFERCIYPIRKEIVQLQLKDLSLWDGK